MSKEGNDQWAGISGRLRAPHERATHVICAGYLWPCTLSKSLVDQGDQADIRVPGAVSLASF